MNEYNKQRINKGRSSPKFKSEEQNKVISQFKKNKTKHSKSFNYQSFNKMNTNAFNISIIIIIKGRQ